MAPPAAPKKSKAEGMQKPRHKGGVFADMTPKSQATVSFVQPIPRKGLVEATDAAPALIADVNEPVVGPVTLIVVGDLSRQLVR